jgi:hypothetical protein
METAEEKQARKAAFRMLIEALGEQGNRDATNMIYLLVEAYTLAFAQRHFERAKQLHETSGMLRPDGQPRTLGGIWFVLVKDEIGPKEFRRVTLGAWGRNKWRQKRREARVAKLAAVDMQSREIETHGAIA